MAVNGFCVGGGIGLVGLAIAVVVAIVAGLHGFGVDLGIIVVAVVEAAEAVGVQILVGGGRAAVIVDPVAWHLLGVRMDGRVVRGAVLGIGDAVLVGILEVVLVGVVSGAGEEGQQEEDVHGGSWGERHHP